MLVSGFSFVRNAVKLDYPVVEAIKSVLPLVDEFVLALGNSDDTTEELIKSINSPKLRIIPTIWDDNLREGGKVLAVETNKALDAINPNAIWAIYIQADECMHEQDYQHIRAAMQAYAHVPQVEGLLFNYRHFYGSYDFVANSRNWYRKEIRIIKNIPGIRSYRDAQGFRLNDEKLHVVAVNASVYHYGWVRHPKYQLAKQLEANKYWHDDAWIEKKFSTADAFDYSSIDSVGKFTGTHPLVMQKRISDMNWQFDSDPSKKNMGLKKRLLHWVEAKTGLRFGEYRNYRLIKP